MPTVSLKPENKQFKVKKDEILFDALNNQGEELPHGCLAGSCGACRIKVTQGADLLYPPSEVESQTIELLRTNYERTHGPGSGANINIRLSCRAKVKDENGEIEIEPL